MSVPGYIQVEFTPNYNGDHRVCYRVGNAGPYTCIIVSCNNDPCVALIEPISFEDEACGPVNYQGYIQAFCEDPNTLDGAIFWSIDFVPNPKCKPYTLTCNGSSDGITGFNIVTSGSFSFDYVGSGNLIECLNSYTGTQIICGVWNGYSLYTRSIDPVIITNNCPQNLYGPGSYCTSLCRTGCQCIFIPHISIIGGGGSGFSAVGRIGIGGVKIPLTFTNGGITNQGVCPGPPGSCDGQYIAQCKNNKIKIGSITVPGIGDQEFIVKVVGGKITSIEPQGYPNQGKYFYSGGNGETFEFDPVDIGGIQNATFKTIPFCTDFGLLIGIDIISPGTGYTGIPQVQIESFTNVLPGCPNDALGGGTQINTVLGTVNCPPFDPGPNCDGLPYLVSGLIPSLPVGSSFNICYTGQADPPSPTIPDEYSVIPSPDCCYDCVELQITASAFDPLPTIAYTDCNTNRIIVFTMTNYSVNLACAMNNSWVSTETSTQFNIIGNCTS